jgi:hypothetical protein
VVVGGAAAVVEDLAVAEAATRAVAERRSRAKPGAKLQIQSAPGGRPDIVSIK